MKTADPKANGVRIFHAEKEVDMNIPHRLENNPKRAPPRMNKPV